MVKDSADFSGNNSDQFCERLKIAIKEIGGVARTARIAGVAESTVRSWRDGNSEPQRPALSPIAKEAGVMVSWLVDGSLPKYRLTAAQQRIANEFDIFAALRGVAGTAARLEFLAAYNQQEFDFSDEIYSEIGKLTEQRLIRYHNTLIDMGGGAGALVLSREMDNVRGVADDAAQYNESQTGSAQALEPDDIHVIGKVFFTQWFAIPDTDKQREIMTRLLGEDLAMDIVRSQFEREIIPTMGRRSRKTSTNVVGLSNDKKR